MPRKVRLPPLKLRKTVKKKNSGSCVGRKPASVCTRTRSCKMTTRRNKGKNGKGRAGHCRKKKNRKSRKSRK